MPGLLYQGVDANDAPQHFTQSVTIDGTTTLNGAVTFGSTVAANGVTLVSANPTSADVGLVSWTFDPASCLDAGKLLVSGTIYLASLWVRAPVTTSTVIMDVVTAGATLTAGENLVGLYSSSGTQVAVTGDQSTAWTTAGVKAMSWTSPVSLAVGRYLVAVLSVGTTPATMAAAGLTGANSLPAANAGASAANARFAVNGTSQTGLAASLTLSGNTNTGALALWAGIA